MFYALIMLVVHGDYTPQWNAVGIAEDHPIIDLILTITGH